MYRTCKMIVWSMLLALVVGWVQVVKAQDQNGGATNQPATQPSNGQTNQPGTQQEHRHRRGRLEKACRQDVAKLCPDAEGGKAIRQCLEQNKDKLSDECTAARAKMKKWRKQQGQNAGAPRTKTPATPPPD